MSPTSQRTSQQPAQSLAGDTALSWEAPNTESSLFSNAADGWILYGTMDENADDDFLGKTDPNERASSPAADLLTTIHVSVSIRAPAHERNGRDDMSETMDIEASCKKENQEEEEVETMDIETSCKKENQGEESDRRLAEKLQAQLNKEADEEKKLVEMAMMESIQGRAWHFVHALLQELESMPQRLDAQSMAADDALISPIATDDLVWLVEHLLVKQEEFRSKDISTHIGIGYHYTMPENLTRIRTDGLLSRMERTELGIQTKCNGTHYGDGIYTCDDPMTYRNKHFGPVGLVVARLKGTTTNTYTPNGDPSDATFVRRRPLAVLRSSSQCVPLIQFTGEKAADVIVSYQNMLMSLIDSFFNGVASTPGGTPLVSAAVSPCQKLKRTRAALMTMFKAPSAAVNASGKGNSAAAALTFAPSMPLAQKQSPASANNFTTVNAVAGIAPVLPAVASPGGESASLRGELPDDRHKQQRLVLLQHAATCKLAPGSCWLTPHCAAMKKLWDHMPQCKSPECTVLHCVSSRYMLSHYRHCKDPNCLPCGPVRETLRQGNQPTQQNGMEQLVGSGVVLGPPGAGSPDAYQREIKRVKLPHDGPLLHGTGALPPVAFNRADLAIEKKHRYKAPETLIKNAMQHVTDDLADCATDSEDCAICLDVLVGKMGRISICGHKFHYECIEQALAHQGRCPLCSTIVAEPQGVMPSGTMKITLLSDVACNGFLPGTIKIVYSIPSGTQMSYHRYVGCCGPCFRHVIPLHSRQPLSFIIPVILEPISPVPLVRLICRTLQKDAIF